MRLSGALKCEAEAFQPLAVGGAPKASASRSGSRRVSRASACSASLGAGARRDSTAAREAAAAIEHAEFAEDLAMKLALPPEELTPAEDEVFLRALRSREIEGAVRLAAALKLARALELREHEVARHSAMELEHQLRQARDILPVKPHLSVELAHVCEASKILHDAASMIFEELEVDALRRTVDSSSPYCYVLVDLADWRMRCGQRDRAAHLLDMARQVEPRRQDPRVYPRHLAWRFDVEPATPHDQLRVEASRPLADAELDVTRPLPSAHRACPCGRRAIGRGRSASQPVLARERPRSSPACGAGDRNQRPSCCSEVSVPGHGPSRNDGAPLASLCRELDRHFGLGGCLVELDEGARAPAGGTDLQSPKTYAAVAAARRLVKARRFAVRLVDVEDTPPALDGNRGDCGPQEEVAAEDGDCEPAALPG